MIRRILLISLVVSVLFRVVAAETYPISVDSLIEARIAASEQALFKANFEEAESYVDVARYRSVEDFRDVHELKLLLQSVRIQEFKGTVLQTAIDPSRTLEFLSAIGEKVERSGDTRVLGDLYAMLSSVYYSLKEQDSASRYNVLALESFTATGDSAKIAQVRGSELSRRHLRFQADGKDDKVMELIPEYEEEIAFAEQCGNKYVLAYNTRHLGQIYLRQASDLTKALDMFQRSLELREEIGFILFLPASYFSVAEVFEKMGTSDSAISRYEMSIALADEIGFKRYRLRSRFALGDLFNGLGDADSAQKIFSEALVIAREYGDEEQIAIAKQKIVE